MVDHDLLASILGSYSSDSPKINAGHNIPAAAPCHMTPMIHHAHQSRAPAQASSPREQRVFPKSDCTLTCLLLIMILNCVEMFQENLSFGQDLAELCVGRPILTNVCFQPGHVNYNSVPLVKVAQLFFIHRLHLGQMLK